jgi:prolyl-tRNA editing enzyme YbaK/EbsC (Cys-tRNA(Pro) deacylase)
VRLHAFDDSGDFCHNDGNTFPTAAYNRKLHSRDLTMVTKKIQQDGTATEAARARLRPMDIELERHWDRNEVVHGMPIYCKTKRKKSHGDRHRFLKKLLSRMAPQRLFSYTDATTSDDCVSDSSTAATESTGASDDSILSVSALSEKEDFSGYAPSQEEDAMISHNDMLRISHTHHPQAQDCNGHDMESKRSECHLASLLKYILIGRADAKAEFHMATTPWHWILSHDEAVELVLLTQEQNNHETDKVTIHSMTESHQPAKATPFNDEQDALPLMERRLLATGLVSLDDFEFVVEDDDPGNTSCGCGNISDNDSHVSNVKTGVWEVTTFGRDKDVTPTISYTVTAIRMEDRVDTKKLRKAVFGVGQQHRRRPKVSLAPKDVAERLVGFKSGTMAPICHSTNMILCLEESILDPNVGLDQQWLHVGCGMACRCLSIRANKFLEIAKTSGGVKECPLIRVQKTQ